MQDKIGLTETPARVQEQQARALPELNSDLLWGGKACAEYLGITLPQLYHLMRTRRLPLGKLGANVIIGSKKKLARYLENLPV